MSIEKKFRGLLWLRYGFGFCSYKDKEMVVIIVNVISTLLNSIYLLFYFYYTKIKVCIFLLCKLFFYVRKILNFLAIRTII